MNSSWIVQSGGIQVNLFFVWIYSCNANHLEYKFSSHAGFYLGKADHPQLGWSENNGLTAKWTVDIASLQRDNQKKQTASAIDTGRSTNASHSPLDLIIEDNKFFPTLAQESSPE